MKIRVNIFLSTIKEAVIVIAQFFIGKFHFRRGIDTIILNKHISALPDDKFCFVTEI